jgi:pilus assembly protein CpaB
MNRRLVIVVAVVFAAFAAAYALLAGGGGARPTPPVADTAPKIETDDVLVAGRDIPMGASVGADDLVWQAWPKAAVSDLMIAKSRSPDGLDEAKGSMTRVPFLRGEPMRRDKLVQGAAGGFMSAILPSGKRAVAIKIDNGGDTSAGGFILPNDRGDVVRLSRDEEASKARGVEVVTARTILANVRVLAIGQNVEEQNGKKVVVGANATLELDPDQVNLIVLAQNQGAANLQLALRSLADSGGPSRTVTEGPAHAGGLTVIRFGAEQQATR